MTDPYQVLGLARGASDEEVARAYKRLAMQFHPDRNPGNKAAEERFKDINAARDAIKAGAAAPPGRGPHPNDPHGGDWFFDFGGHGPAGAGRPGNGYPGFDDILAALHAQAHRRNRDVTVECRISLEDAFAGTEVNVQLRGAVGFRTLAVRVPAGVDDGNRVRVAQAGDQTVSSMVPGDLYLVVRVLPHARFARQGRLLHTMAEVDVFDLLIGGAVQVEGIDGSRFEVAVPPGFDPAQPLRAAGHGMPAPNGTEGRGDLLVTVRPRFPLLSEAQRDLVKRAKECMG